MPVEIPKDKWPGQVRTITLGATAQDGGTRAHTVTVGGQKTLPYMHFEQEAPHRPLVALEIMNRRPDDWSALLLKTWGDAMNDPAAWAKAAEQPGADLLLLSLAQADASGETLKPAEAVAAVKAVLGATGLPLIVFGPGQADQDNDLLVPIAEATKGERLVLGICEDKNYRTIVATAMANGHLVTARTRDGCQPRQAVEHPDQRHGPAVGSRADGPDDGRTRLRHRVRLLGDGAPAPGRAARRRDDSAADDRCPSVSRRGRPRNRRWAKACPANGAIGTRARSTGK